MALSARLAGSKITASVVVAGRESYTSSTKAKSELRAQGSGFRVQGSGFRVQGSGFRVRGSGFGVRGSGFRKGAG
jgi:hypothetical protein